MNISIETVLTSVVIGDALGAPLSGLSRGHIHNHFPGISSYVDPEPALKGKLEKWTMPGLYTSIGQLSIITGLMATRKGLPLTSFQKIISETPGNDQGIFRNPDITERSLFLQGHHPLHGYPSSRIIIPPAITAFKIKNAASLFQNVLENTAMSTENPCNIAGALILAETLREALGEPLSKKTDLIPRTLDIIDTVTRQARENSGKIFDLKLNPDYLEGALEAYKNTCTALIAPGTLEEKEEIICREVNATLRTPVKRATVNHPLAILPMGLFLASRLDRQPQSLLFEAVSLGGEASALGAITGFFAALCGETEHLTDTLTDNLVNKKRIMSLNDPLKNEKGSFDVLQDFIRGEAGLTAKYIQERDARLKHQKKHRVDKPHKKKPPRSKEEQLSRHIVESWTKIDQARWRKEQRKKETE